MNRFRLNWIVGYIRSAGEFPFSVEDVAEDLDGVLSFFDVVESLSAEECQELKGDLKLLALVEEEAEVVRLLVEKGMIEVAEAPQLVSSCEDKLRVR